nr:putative integron gene cassette protein [uncultured bacterium]
MAATVIPFGCHAMLRIVHQARSCFACVTFARFGNSVKRCLCSATDTVASETPDCKFSGARPGLPASSFGKCVGTRFASASTAA